MRIPGVRNLVAIDHNLECGIAAHQSVFEPLHLLSPEIGFVRITEPVRSAEIPVVKQKKLYIIILVLGIDALPVTSWI